jgi:hypothetical protein
MLTPTIHEPPVERWGSRRLIIADRAEEVIAGDGGRIGRRGFFGEKVECFDKRQGKKEEGFLRGFRWAE